MKSNLRRFSVCPIWMHPVRQLLLMVYVHRMYCVLAKFVPGPFLMLRSEIDTRTMNGTADGDVSTFG